MATPGETRSQLLKDLRTTRTFLMSPEWLTKIRAATPTQQQTHAENLVQTQLALLDLENEVLATFRDDLIANEAAIGASTKKMRDAIEQLESVAQVLTAVKGFLGVVARVVTLI